LEGLALSDGDDVGRWWAGRVLAYVGALVEADHERLWKRNEAYRWQRMELGRMLRGDVWFPGNPLYQALHRELWLCEFYRGEVALPFGERDKAEKWGSVPGEYESVLELAPLSAKSWKDWEKIFVAVGQAAQSGFAWGFGGAV
jgi:hypothetical protein